MRFSSPLSPTYDKGYLIIHADHAVLGNLTHWHPKIKRLNQKVSGWRDTKAVNFGVAVNSATVDTAGHMTHEQLKNMYDEGVEIINHNRHHISIGAKKLTQPVAAGSSVVQVATTDYFGMHALSELGYPYSYEIISGSTRETVYFTNYTSNTFTLSQPLSKSFPVGSILKPTQETLEDLVLGCLDDMRAWGIDDVTSYSYPDHSATHFDPYQPSVDYVLSLHDSARGGYGETQAIDQIVWGDLQGFAIRPGGTPALSEIDRILDKTASDNLLAIVWSHGETHDDVMERLNYIVQGALMRGIRIITQKQAVNLFKR